MDNHWEVVNASRNVVSNSPEELWENACLYFQWTDSHPRITFDTVRVGKDQGKQLEIHHKRPYSIKALCMHCGIDEEYFTDLRKNAQPGSGWHIAVSRILYVIYTEMLEGGLAGDFNSILVGKILNFEEPVTPDSTITVNVVNGLPPLSNSENEVLKKLELEISLKNKEQSENPERAIDLRELE